MLFPARRIAETKVTVPDSSSRACRNVVLLFIFVLLAGIAQAAPVRLGILSDGPSRAAAELLTVELGRSAEFELVERDQIEKVLAEQSAAALSEDPGAAIKVGGLLHADAILFIGDRNVRGAPRRVLRLSAVEPGVVVHVATEPAPEAGEEPAWAKSLAFRLGPMAAKLKLKKDQLIPFSVLNFRSEIGGEANRELERKITAAVEEQLAAQPGVVLLERRKLDALEFERICKWDRETAHFWTCGGLIDGSIAPGTETNRFTLTGIYNPPGGDIPRKVNISFEEDKLDSAAKACAEGLVRQYATFRKTDCWSPMAEGERFWEEAKSAYNAKLFAEAAAAIEVAGILGFKNPMMARVRTDSYLRASLSSGDAGVRATDARYQQWIKDKENISPNGKEAFRLHAETILVEVNRLSPEFALRAAESFEEELAESGTPFNPAVMPAYLNFAELTSKFMVLMNCGAAPLEFSGMEKDLSAELSRLNNQVAQKLDEAAANIQSFCKSESEAQQFVGFIMGWYGIMIRHTPAWASSNEVALEFYRRTMRVFEQPHLLTFSYTNFGIDYRLAEIFTTNRFSHAYSKSHIEYPFFLDKQTGQADMEAEKRWLREFEKYDTDLARLARLADRTRNAYARRSRKELDEHFDFEMYVAGKQAVRIKELVKSVASPPRIHNVRHGTLQPPLFETCGILTAELFWEPPLADIQQRHSYPINPGNPSDGQWPGATQTKVMDVRTSGKTHWFMLAAYPRHTSEGPCLLWLIRRGEDGREHTVELTPKPAVVRGDPAQLWATDEKLVVACVERNVVLHDLATRQSKVVPMQEECRNPVLSGSWIYCTFHGESAGVLRMDRNTLA